MFCPRWRRHCILLDCSAAASPNHFQPLSLAPARAAPRLLFGRGFEACGCGHSRQLSRESAQGHVQPDATLRRVWRQVRRTALHSPPHTESHLGPTRRRYRTLMLPSTVSRPLTAQTERQCPVTPSDSLPPSQHGRNSNKLQNHRVPSNPRYKFLGHRATMYRSNSTFPSFLYRQGWQQCISCLTRTTRPRPPSEFAPSSYAVSRV